MQGSCPRLRIVTKLRSVKIEHPHIRPEELTPWPESLLAFLWSLARLFVGLLLVTTLFSLLIGLNFGWDRVWGSFLSPGNLRLVAVQAAIPAAVALGMTIIMISGGIDLSVGYVVSLVTVVTMLAFRQAVDQSWRGYLARRFHVDFPYLEFMAATASVWAVAAGLATGVLAGWTNGTLIARLG